MLHGFRLHPAESASWISIKQAHSMQVPPDRWFRNLVAGLSLRILGLNPRRVHIGAVVGKMALRQVSPPPKKVSFPLSASVHKCSILSQ
jgi:hypothetical protein